MKKKIVAALCSAALVLALPMAAFADISPEKTVDGDTTTFEFEEGTITDWVYNDETGKWEEVNILESVVVEGAENVTVSNVKYVEDENGDFVPDGYTAESWKEYKDKINQVISDKGTELFQFEINGDVTGDKAVVTFQLNADEYGNKVINYYILHKDGSIQEKVVRVNADGTVTIWMESFSIITFMDVDGITKYENLVEPQDGELLSPKTGVC